MELEEQTTRLLDENSHDRPDSPDVEQNPVHIPSPHGKGTVRRGWRKRKWRDPSWRDLVAVAVLVGVVCGALGYTLGFWARKSPGRASRPGIVPLRIMIVGDSISEGFESMHTWRYRLWEWFQANDVSVTFVGPFHQTALQKQDLSTGVPLPAARPGDGHRLRSRRRARVPSHRKRSLCHLGQRNRAESRHNQPANPRVPS